MPSARLRSEPPMDLQARPSEPLFGVSMPSSKSRKPLTRNGVWRRAPLSPTTVSDAKLPGSRHVQSRNRLPARRPRRRWLALPHPTTHTAHAAGDSLVTCRATLSYDDSPEACDPKIVGRVKLHALHDSLHRSGRELTGHWQKRGMCLGGPAVHPACRFSASESVAARASEPLDTHAGCYDHFSTQRSSVGTPGGGGLAGKAFQPIDLVWPMLLQ